MFDGPKATLSISAHRALIAGGGAPEIEVAQRLRKHAQTLTGKLAYCVNGFADALEVIPTRWRRTLA